MGDYKVGYYREDGYTLGYYRVGGNPPGDFTEGKTRKENGLVIISKWVIIERGNQLLIRKCVHSLVKV